MTAACLVLAAPPACAGTFSPPIRLPGQANLTEWHVAVNDSGDGVAVRGSITGEEIYQDLPNLGSRTPTRVDVAQQNRALMERS
jgi:hypothetical protein